MPMAHDLPWLVRGEAGYWMINSFFVATKPWLP